MLLWVWFKCRMLMPNGTKATSPHGPAPVYVPRKGGPCILANLPLLGAQRCNKLWLKVRVRQLMHPNLPKAPKLQLSLDDKYKMQYNIIANRQQTVKLIFCFN